MPTSAIVDIPQAEQTEMLATLRTIGCRLIVTIWSSWTCRLRDPIVSTTSFAPCLCPRPHSWESAVISHELDLVQRVVFATIPPNRARVLRLLRDGDLPRQTL